MRRARAICSRGLTMAALAALVGLAIGACGDDDGSEGATDASTESGAAATGDTTGVSLQFAGFASSPAEDEALKKVIAAYEEQSGNTVQINLSPSYDTTLQAALASGSPPDVFYVQDGRFRDLVDAGALAPAGDNLTDADDFYPSLRETFSVDGEFYCPPKDFSTLGLVYDPDALAAAGVEPPTTWEELAAAAEKLTTPDGPGLVIEASLARWGAFMYGAGGAVLSDDETSSMLADGGAAIGFQFLADLHAEGFAMTATDLGAGWPGEAFAKGQAPMTVEGNWIAGFLDKDYPDKSWAVAELPAGPEGQATYVFTTCYGVAAQAKNPAAAWNLVNYLVSPEPQLEYTSQFPVMPGRESVKDAWLEAHPDLEPFLAGAEYAKPYQFPPGFQEALDEINAGIVEVSRGNDDVDTLIGRADEAVAGVVGG